MATDDEKKVAPPFTAFNFNVNLTLSDDSLKITGAFSECSGLEITMTPKTIREGGNNRAQIHLVGPISYGQLSLKRGMADDSLWKWFDIAMQPGKARTRASGQIELLAEERSTIRAKFVITGCLPIKLRAPAMNAASGQIAVEELQIAYETLKLG